MRSRDTSIAVFIQIVSRQLQTLQGPPSPDPHRGAERVHSDLIKVTQMRLGQGDAIYFPGHKDAVGRLADGLLQFIFIASRSCVHPMPEEHAAVLQASSLPTRPPGTPRSPGTRVPAVPSQPLIARYVAAV